MGFVPADFPISDMYVFPLQRSERGVVLLREADHLLRRFGQLEIVDLKAGEQTDFALRSEADRFIFPISGLAIAELLDLRQASPSRGVRTRVTLDASSPQGLLAPFGVALSLRSESGTRVALLSTHSEAHPEDRSPTSDELQKYTAIQ